MKINNLTNFYINNNSLTVVLARLHSITMTTPTTIGIVTIIDVSQVEVNQKKNKEANSATII